MAYLVFKTMAEVLAWAKERFAGCSLSVNHLEGNRYVVIVKGKGRVQREVVYVKWDKEKSQTS